MRVVVIAGRRPPAAARLRRYHTAGRPAHARADGVSGWDVCRAVVGHASAVALAGIAVGLLRAFVAGRALEWLLFGVSATDPLVWLPVAGGLFVRSVSAALVPAIRAAAVDPAVAIRAE
jgi:hypothetical protein